MASLYVSGRCLTCTFCHKAINIPVSDPNIQTTTEFRHHGVRFLLVRKGERAPESSEFFPSQHLEFHFSLRAELQFTCCHIFPRPRDVSADRRGPRGGRRGRAPAAILIRDLCWMLREKVSQLPQPVSMEGCKSSGHFIKLILTVKHSHIKLLSWMSLEVCSKIHKLH